MRVTILIGAILLAALALLPAQAQAEPATTGAQKILKLLQKVKVRDAQAVFDELMHGLGRGLRHGGKHLGRWGILNTEQAGRSLIEKPSVRRQVARFIRANAATLRVQGAELVRRQGFHTLLEKGLGKALFARTAEAAYRTSLRSAGSSLTVVASEVAKQGRWGRFAGYARGLLGRVGRFFGGLFELATSVTLASILNFATVAQITDAGIDAALESYQTSLETIEEAEDLEAYNNNVRLLTAALAAGRVELRPGITLATALRRVRANLAVGRTPFHNLLAAKEPQTPSTPAAPVAGGEVWVLDGAPQVDAKPGGTHWKRGASIMSIAENQVSAGSVKIFREVWKADRKTGAKRGSEPIRRWRAGARVSGVPGTLRPGQPVEVKVDADASLLAGKGWVFIEGWIKGEGLVVTPKEKKRGYFHARPGARPTDSRTWTVTMTRASNVSRKLILTVRGVATITWTYRKRG